MCLFTPILVSFLVIHARKSDHIEMLIFGSNVRSNTLKVLEGILLGSVIGMVWSFYIFVNSHAWLCIFRLFILLWILRTYKFRVIFCTLKLLVEFLASYLYFLKDIVLRSTPGAKLQSGDNWAILSVWNFIRNACNSTSGRRAILCYYFFLQFFLKLRIIWIKFSNIKIPSILHSFCHFFRLDCLRIHYFP